MLSLNLPAIGCGWQWSSLIPRPKKKEGVIFILGIGDERWNVRNVSWAMGEPGREKARAKLTGSGMTTGRVGYTSVEGK